MGPVQETTDADVWARLHGGDSDALGVLFDRHHRAVYNHCFRLTASWSAAEDLASQVFLEVWRQRNRIELRLESARPWLLTVATNLARNELRARLRRRRLAQRVWVIDDEPDPADDVAARVDDERRMRSLLVLLGDLPRAEREAIALCIWSDVSYADAATALGITESSVRARVSRGRARLARAASGADRTPHRTVEERS